MAQLTCQKLCVGYDGKPVLQDLDFEIFAGDYLCIVGENGSGKRTLFYMSYIEQDLRKRKERYHGYLSFCVAACENTSFKLALIISSRNMR